MQIKHTKDSRKLYLSDNQQTKKE